MMYTRRPMLWCVTCSYDVKLMVVVVINVTDHYVNRVLDILQVILIRC